MLVPSKIAYMFVVDIKKILKKKLNYQEEFNTSQVVFNYVSHLHIFRYCWNILYFQTFLELGNGGEDEHADGGEQEQRGHDHQNLYMFSRVVNIIILRLDWIDFLTSWFYTLSLDWDCYAMLVW